MAGDIYGTMKCTGTSPSYTLFGVDVWTPAIKTFTGSSAYDYNNYHPATSSMT
jgi:hypothetical protein